MPRIRAANGVSPVIATILLVAITVVLAAVLYVTTSQMTSNTEVTPYVSMIIAGQNSTAVQVTVAQVSQQSLSLGKFQGIVLADGLVDEASRMRPLAGGTTAGNLTFQSLDGVLNGGDRLTVRVSGTGHTYILSINFLGTGAESGKITFDT